jgi:hypothetical protein
MTALNNCWYSVMHGVVTTYAHCVSLNDCWYSIYKGVYCIPYVTTNVTYQQLCKKPMVLCK